jgi:N6-adenosine-specific RNA methylase IME4
METHPARTFDLELGRWVRSRHEVLLIGTRGNPPAPAPGEQWESVMEAPRGEHSEKPEAFYELIEAYFPTVSKIELNARKRRSGWEAWGLEAPEAEHAP